MSGEWHLSAVGIPLICRRQSATSTRLASQSRYDFKDYNSLVTDRQLPSSSGLVNAHDNDEDENSIKEVRSTASAGPLSRRSVVPEFSFALMSHELHGANTRAHVDASLSPVPVYCEGIWDCTATYRYRGVWWRCAIGIGGSSWYSALRRVLNEAEDRSGRARAGPAGSSMPQWSACAAERHADGFTLPSYYGLEEL